MEFKVVTYKPIIAATIPVSKEYAESQRAWRDIEPLLTKRIMQEMEEGMEQLIWCDTDNMDGIIKHIT